MDPEIDMEPTQAGIEALLKATNVFIFMGMVCILTSDCKVGVLRLPTSG